MFCPKCGTEYEGNFCPNGCNSPKNICPKCKTEYAGAFCPKCGTGVTGTPPQKPPKKKFPVWAVVLICIGAVLVLFIIIGVIGAAASGSSSSGGGKDSISSSLSDGAEDPPSSSDASSDEPGSDSSEDSSNSSEVSSSEPEEDVVKVTAEELFAAYDANEAAAEQKYKGKLLEITGTVDNIGRDILDDLYVTLETGEKYSLRSVQCYINEKDQATVDRVTELSKGDTVIIR